MEAATSIVDIRLDAKSVLEPDVKSTLQPAVEEAELPPPPPPPPARPPKNSPLEWLYLSTRHLADTVTLDEISPSPFPITTTGGFETLCSYNWVDTHDPTIIVPGGAAKYTHLAFPVKLRPDAGVTFSDLNRAKAPRQPFKGVFTALTLMSPRRKLDDVDVILTRGAFQSLYKFAKGGCSTAFILQMNLINKTLVLTYREGKNRRFNGGKIQSWGHAFEEGFTAYDDELKGSIAHHRVVKYQFGSLRVAVLHEVDVSYSAPSESPGPAATSGGGQAFFEKRSGATDLGHLVRSNQDLEVRPFGTGTAAENVAEMKAIRKPLSETGIPSDARTQCWFGRTGTLMFGLHTEGVFQSVDVREFDFEPWCQSNQEPLQRTAAVFEKLREQTRRLGNCGVAVLNPASCKTRLEIWTPHRPVVFNPVPHDTVRRHWTFRNDAPRSRHVQPADRGRRRGFGERAGMYSYGERLR